jgi:hypothetical protein
MSKMSDLRDALETVVNSGGVSMSDHPAAIAAISSRFQHSIQRVPDAGQRPYNCYMFALGLLDNDRIYEILQKDAGWYGLAGVRVGPEFVSSVMQNGTVVKNDAGEVVIYLRDGSPVHAGLITGKRVKSKWGIGGLWEHNLWEVPRSYGDTAQTYTVARPELLESEFETYADELIASKGGYPD